MNPFVTRFFFKNGIRNLFLKMEFRKWAVILHFLIVAKDFILIALSISSIYIKKNFIQKNNGCQAYYYFPLGLG